MSNFGRKVVSLFLVFTVTVFLSFLILFSFLVIVVYHLRNNQ